MSELVAWSVEIDSMTCVVFATTKPKARWLAVSAYWEAGYGRKRMWPRPVAWREPRFDKSALNGGEIGRAYTREYVETYP